MRQILKEVVNATATKSDLDGMFHFDEQSELTFANGILILPLLELGDGLCLPDEDRRLWSLQLLRGYGNSASR